MIENLTVLRGNPSPAYPYDEGESRRSRACSLVEAEPEAVIDQLEGAEANCYKEKAKRAALVQRGKTELEQLHDNFSAKIHTIQNKHACDVAAAKEKLARDLKSAQESMMDDESMCCRNQISE